MKQRPLPTGRCGKRVQDRLENIRNPCLWAIAVNCQSSGASCFRAACARPLPRAESAVRRRGRAPDMCQDDTSGMMKFGGPLY